MREMGNVVPLRAPRRVHEPDPEGAALRRAVDRLIGMLDDLADATDPLDVAEVVARLARVADGLAVLTDRVREAADR